MSDELDDLFGSDDMAIPTMRGNANLDIQDYADVSSEGTFLDDDLQEDVRSTPGSGAAPAPDIDGTSDYEMEPEYDGPDAVQTTFGASPWGPGAGGGYRPMSMARTDLSGNEEAAEINVDSVMKVGLAQPSQMNAMPSNRDVDPETMYDRTSYEFASGSDAVIGNGIFEMEEGVTWRAEDGSFSHQYAFPAYIAEEDELGTQQSEMFDVVADNWRVVQPSGGGVTFSTKVPYLRGRPMQDRAYSPFTAHLKARLPEPKSSRIERFGRDAASVLLREAASKTSPSDRQQFLVNAINSLGPGMAEKCHRVAERMVRMGMMPQQALEETIAHCAMHAAIRDLSVSSGGSKLPSLDAMGAHVVKNKGKLKKSAVENLAPLAKNKTAAKADIAKLYQSPAAASMGEIASEPAAPTAPAAATPAAPIAQDNTVRNVAIAAAVGVAVWALATKTSKGQEVTATVVANTRSVLGLKPNKKRRRSRRSK